MHQLDIFNDSAPIQFANELFIALARFDRDALAPALNRLASADPRFAGLPQLQLLCDFLGGWPSQCSSADQVADCEFWISAKIVPASRLMGAFARPMLKRLWSDLAFISEALGIGPDKHNYFAAELYLRAGLPADAVRVASKISEPTYCPSVQRWLALGLFRINEGVRGYFAALRCAWLDPEGFSALVSEIGSDTLSREWKLFQSDLGGLDASWFPAWCTHEKKLDLRMVGCIPPGPGPEAYGVVCKLLEREKQGLTAALFDDRARLRNLGDEFFDFYMRRRGGMSFVVFHINEL